MQYDKFCAERLAVAHRKATTKKVSQAVFFMKSVRIARVYDRIFTDLPD